MLDKFRFRDPELTERVVQRIRELTPKRSKVRICHVCGTHEWTITHYGLRSLLPENVDVIAGPGCPVCIVPASEFDEAIELSSRNIAITCFGDVLRVPGSDRSLMDAKAEGADVCMVYSVSDAVKMAEKQPSKDFCFFAVGFETTAPSTAVEILHGPPSNLSFLISHRTIPPALRMLMEIENLDLQGIIAPGHVSAIIGLKPYEFLVKNYRVPTVIAGFEPLDLLFAISMILQQLQNNEPCLENEYARAVSEEGNLRAKKSMQDVFNEADGNWRGLGRIPSSKLFLKEEFSSHDAHQKYNVKIESGRDQRSECKCHLIIVGRAKPTDCQLFMKYCTPQNPVGACMVGSEGTCRIWARA